MAASLMCVLSPQLVFSFRGNEFYILICSYRNVKSERSVFCMQLPLYKLKITKTENTAKKPNCALLWFTKKNPSEHETRYILYATAH